MPRGRHGISGRTLILATTTSTQDRGLLDVLLPAFEKESGIRVKTAAVRTRRRVAMDGPRHTMRMLWSMEKSEMQKRHVLFQEEDKDTYVRALLEQTLGGATA